MKKVLLFLLVFIGLTNIHGQTTIFSENIGTGSGTQAITATTFQNASLTFTGTADTRTTSSSSGYTGSSGGKNVFITNTVGTNFQIAGINTTNYTNLALSFGALKTTTASNLTELVLEYSTDGISYTTIAFPAQSTGTGTAIWRLISGISLPSAANGASNLRLRWRQTSASPQFRIDDITLTGILAATNPTVQFTAATYNVNENAGTVNATVCVAITNPNVTATSVDVALTGGTATNGTDLSTYTTQTLTFPASSSTDQCISFTLTNDALFEGTETLIFTLQNSTNSATIGTNGTTTVSILDNDFPQIIITEIMIDPCSGTSGFWANEGNGEYVEIYNAESSAVDISGYMLEDEAGTVNFFTFPTSTSLPAGGFAVVANTTLYNALDIDANNTIDVGNTGAGSLIFNKGNANAQLDNDTADGLELTDASNNLLDKVNWNEPSCITSNDGFSAVLLAPYTADNSNINTANWFPSLDGGNGTAGGGTPGAANTAGACIGTVTATAAGVSCGTSSASLTVAVEFTVENSAVSEYDIYRDDVFFATYSAGTTADGTYTYTTPNLSPVNMTTINFEVRPNGAPTNTCYSANKDATITSCLLPVELTTFTATAINQTIALAWTTASEEKNDYFQMERSLNGTKFEVLGKVKGTGTTLEPQAYSFVDAAPKAGVNYYRLKQVDYDGAFEYSNIVAAVVKYANQSLFAYPSPTSDLLVLESAVAIEQIEIRDMAGRILNRQTFGKEQTRVELNVATLTSGSYFVHVRSGAVSQVVRFVKQ